MDCKGKSGIAQGLPWQSLQGVQVQSLVGKLISHMPQGLAKFKKKKQSETAREGMGTQEDD